VTRGAVRVGRRDPKMSSSVAIASFAGAKTNPFDSDASTDSTGVAPTISRARSNEP
jgi:hypothetical protein